MDGGEAADPRVVPTGGGTDKAGAALASLTTQLREVNEAYLTLRTTSTATAKDSIAAAELHMRIETQLAATLRGIPENDPRRAQIEAQTRALEEARTRYDDFKKAVQLADQTQARFGDGTREHAETMRQLNEALATGRLTQDAYALAIRGANEALQAQADRAAEARGGLEGFTAGWSAAARMSERANSTFKLGQEAFTESTRLMSDALVEFARTGELSFGRLLGSFGEMLIQMGLKAAASSLFGGIGSLFGGGGVDPTGGGGGGIFGGIFKAIRGLFGFAEGGRPPLGRPSIVGENGPELFVPDAAGTVYNQRQLAGMGGGGSAPPIVINQTFGDNIGGATRAELRQVGAMAVEAAKNAVYDAVRRGGAYSAAFRPA
jgi:lambda family phage tail tape measure protein